MIYSFRNPYSINEYFIFQNDSTDPFDGPMTKDEAEILCNNFNETDEPYEDDPNPIIAHTAKVLNEIKIAMTKIPQVVFANIIEHHLKPLE